MGLELLVFCQIILSVQKEAVSVGCARGPLDIVSGRENWITFD